MKKLPLLISYTMLLFLCCCAQKTDDKNSTATNDSIEKYLGLAGNDTLDFEKRIKYNDKALSFIDLKKNDSLARHFLITIASNYLKTKKWITYKSLSKICFQKSIKAKDPLALAKLYRYKGSYYRKTQVYDSAYYYFSKAEKLYKKTNDKYGLAIIYLNESIVEYSMEDYLRGELSAKKAYKYLKKNKYYNYDLYACLENLGNIYSALKEFEKAISVHKESLMLLKKHNIPNRQNDCLVGTCLNNIGNVYKEQEKYNKAIGVFKIALKEKNLFLKDPELYAYLLNNLGFCYLRTNNLNNLPNLFFISDKIFTHLGIKNESVVSNLNLSHYYFTKKDTLKAQLYAEKALKIAKSTNAPYYYLTALSNAGTINRKKAPEYIKEYHQKNDSLIFAERNTRTQYYKIQLETDEIVQQKETAIKQKWIIIGITLSLVLIVILIFIITHQRVKQRELGFLQSQQHANEEIYQLMLTQSIKEEEARENEKKRIAKELHDGVMNRLASTRLNLSVLSNKRDDKTIQACITHISNIYQIEQEIRSIAHGMNQDTFKKSNNYIQLLQDFIIEQNAHNATYYELELDQYLDWDNVLSELKMNLYRIIQEASNNINKHSNAKKAIVSIVKDDNNICLSITDDGIGFDTSMEKEGIGILNIEHRVKSLRGKFTINSILNKSTSINISIPL